MVKDGFPQNDPRLFGTILKVTFGLFWACCDPYSASKSPTFAPFGAIWVRFGLFWPQVGVPPKMANFGPNNCEKRFSQRCS